MIPVKRQKGQGPLTGRRCVIALCLAVPLFLSSAGIDTIEEMPWASVDVELRKNVCRLARPDGSFYVQFASVAECGRNSPSTKFATAIDNAVREAREVIFSLKHFYSFTPDVSSLDSMSDGEIEDSVLYNPDVVRALVPRIRSSLESIGIRLTDAPDITRREAVSITWAELVPSVVAFVSFFDSPDGILAPFKLCSVVRDVDNWDPTDEVAVRLLRVGSVIAIDTTLLSETAARFAYGVDPTTSIEDRKSAFERSVRQDEDLKELACNILERLRSDFEIYVQDCKELERKGRSIGGNVQVHH